MILSKVLNYFIYDPEYSKKIKERKHLHKIVVKETWIFGDDYTYGADDLSLKNVLKTHLQYLGREDFEEIINSEDNSDLGIIPDVCLWQQYNLGKADYLENLVIELKKPTKNAGIEELNQIKTYATKVSEDARFTKDKTKWTFILLVKDVKNEIKNDMEQEDRIYGHVIKSKHVNVFVKCWGDVIRTAETKYKYIKDKLNLNLQTNEDALSLLREKYKQYLPDDF